MTEEGERVTLLDEAVGARLYIAPELEDGRAIDVGATADVYSLGKLLYWMVAGKVFAREKHRESPYDLTKDQGDPAYFMIYEILDDTITAQPQQRIPNAGELAKLIDLLIERIQMCAHAIDPNAPPTLHLLWDW